MGKCIWLPVHFQNNFFFLPCFFQWKIKGFNNCWKHFENIDYRWYFVFLWSERIGFSWQQKKKSKLVVRSKLLLLVMTSKLWDLVSQTCNPNYMVRIRTDLSWKTFLIHRLLLSSCSVFWVINSNSNSKTVFPLSFFFSFSFFKYLIFNLYVCVFIYIYRGLFAFIFQ